MREKNFRKSYWALDIGNSTIILFKAVLIERRPPIFCVDTAIYAVFFRLGPLLILQGIKPIQVFNRSTHIDPYKGTTIVATLSTNGALSTDKTPFSRKNKKNDPQDNCDIQL